LFGKGLSIKEIAERIHLSQHTVETHRRNIKEKLKITSNSQLIKLAVEWSSSRKLPIKST
ncbi:MAG: LuxR C-terminal-related transcriptional regulator, partial [Spirochaetota bacterium]|nr:LuxR C-terminal-related transcriptional regulator [Spirochaetota bacterium]